MAKFSFRNSTQGTPYIYLIIESGEKNDVFLSDDGTCWQLSEFLKAWNNRVPKTHNGEYRYSVNIGKSCSIRFISIEEAASFLNDYKSLKGLPAHATQDSMPVIENEEKMEESLRKATQKFTEASLAAEKIAPRELH